MPRIPTKLSEKDFNTYILPHLSKAKRGFTSLIPLYLVFNGILHKIYTGCQWKELAVEKFKDPATGKQLSYQTFYYHFRKWSGDESLFKVFKASIVAIELHLNLSEINLDGTHTIAKKGGEAVKYQFRKKAKTSNILPLTDGNGNIIGYMPVTSGNHNDAFDLKNKLTDLFKFIKALGLIISDAFLNADKGFDIKAARKVCFNYRIIPNICENKRNRKKTKRGRKRLFNADVFHHRFVLERSFARVGKFRGLIIRFDKKEDHFLGQNLIAFTMVNLRNVI